MSDSGELHRSLGKKYRRRRKHTGETWKPQKDQVLSTPGIYCSACRSRHTYSNKEHLGTSYERRSGVWHCLWVCKRSGQVIKDMPLLRSNNE